MITKVNNFTDSIVSNHTNNSSKIYETIQISLQIASSDKDIKSIAD